MLKRRWPPGLHKKNEKPKVLRGRHYVYDLVKDTNIEKQPDINLILTSFVDGYGQVGDNIKVKPTIAYNKLLLPGLAVYATPENIQKYSNVENKDDKVVHSSPFAQRVSNFVIITVELPYNEVVKSRKYRQLLYMEIRYRQVGLYYGLNKYFF